MVWETLKSLFAAADRPQAVFKDEWVEALERNLPLYSKLPGELRERLHLRVARFVESTRFEGCNGLELTEDMIITVAGQACLLVLQREGEPYPKLKTVYLYPSTFRSHQRRQDESGIVTEGVVSRLGESWNTGTVILAWDSVVHGARNVEDGHNVTLHEFSHQLDHEDGPTDGAPPLRSAAAYRSWARVFGSNYEDFHKLLKGGKKTLLDPYGATHPAEFFAVATEVFFEKPRQLARRRNDLYLVLADFYGVDPLTWKR